MSAHALRRKLLRVPEVVYSPMAVEDLDRIWEYISSDLDSPRAAGDIVAGILDAVENLASFPLSGTSLSALFPIDTSYRFVGYGNFLAFYRYADAVHVDRVLYAKSDYLQTLLGDYSIEDF